MIFQHARLIYLAVLRVLKHLKKKNHLDLSSFSLSFSLSSSVSSSSCLAASLVLSSLFSSLDLIFSSLVSSLLFHLLLPSCLVSSSLVSPSLSFFLCLLSLSLCLCPRVMLCVLCCVVCVVVVVVCVWCVFVCCGTLKRRGKNPCVHSKKSPCMPAPRPHVFQHVCAWCRDTRGRFERTHGDVLNVHTGAGGHRQFCLPEFAHVWLSRVSEVHHRNFWIFPIFSSWRID